MSRRSFRAEVEAPRPAAAWMLVMVASACLWITQQLDVWVIGVQTTAILFSLWRRETPFRWQKSPIMLNLGMIGIVAVTIEVALRNVPSTISLAHFAALTQGLQLLDSRPRKTEFLLVTMALFQVVLAANLTDSIFFPPLLIAFVVSTTWTLLVHTLRTEAIEAGDPRGVNRAVTPGLLRMALFGSTLSIALALLIFMLLPRMRSSVLTASSLRPTVATSGFSNRVSLGDIGRIRSDPTIVMRVETLKGHAPDPRHSYWRGLAFDRFDGASWWITPSSHIRVPGSAESGIHLGRRDEPVDLVQRIVREPVEAGVLFAMGRPRHFQGTVRVLERDSSGGFYAAGQRDERIRYIVGSQRPNPSEESLREDSTVPEPRKHGRNLQLPPFSMDVAGLAELIVSQQTRDADRVRAIERYLIVNGRYTDTPPEADPNGAFTAIEIFLQGGMAGHCEYFASSMIVLARSIGIPARLVNGFAGGHANRFGDFIEVARADAHSWVEIHYEKAGWVRYDPTPPDLRARPEVLLSFSEQMKDFASAVELYWYQHVVGFDRSDQMHAVKRAWLAWRGARNPQSIPQLPKKSTGWTGIDYRKIRDWLAPAAALVALSVLSIGLRYRRSQRTDVPWVYREALRLLAKRGIEREPPMTARAFAGSVRRKTSATVARAFDALTESYLSERFGGRTSPTFAEQLNALRNALRAG